MIDITGEDPHPFNYGEQKERSSHDEYFGIAFFSDTHLGYYAHHHTNAEGVNLREIDGEQALYEIATSIIADPNVNVVLHGGDFFHTPYISNRSADRMKQTLNMFARHGIPTLGQAGNHDASDVIRDVSPVALLNDPYRKIYALHKPYQTYRIHDDIYLHAVAHHGLKAEDTPTVKPIPGAINIFSTHGAAVDPKNATLMKCEDSVREQFIPPEMLIDDNFAAKLLGHYHERYAVGGGQFNTWYAGSSIRRGFSDNEGARGWMLVKVFADGTIEVENRNIHQRPQHDFKTIDAAGMTASEVQQLIEENINSIIDPSDDVFDELNAPIVRQRVKNMTRAKRSGIDRKRLAMMGRNMLHWDPSFSVPEMIEQDTTVAVDKTNPSLAKNSGSAGAVEFFDNWVENSNTLSQLSGDTRKKVQKTARTHLETAEEKRGK